MEIVPAGAGVASDVICAQGSGHTPEDLWTGSWKNHQLSATASDGWKFSHFEWDWIATSPDGTRRGTGEAYGNPTPDNQSPSWTAGSLTEYDVAYDDGRAYTQTITAFRAVFVPATGKIVVTAAPSTDTAREAGCTATVNESSRFEADGTPGEYVKIQITATAADGWKFRRWLRNGVPAEYVPEIEYNLPFPAAGEVREIEMSARFLKDTGEILCNADGEILRGSGGGVLYKC